MGLRTGSSDPILLGSEVLKPPWWFQIPGGFFEREGTLPSLSPFVTSGGQRDPLVLVRGCLSQKTPPGFRTDLFDGVPEETKEEIEDIQRGL